MLTLEQTLADQSDLGTLCADRELITREIFSPNAYYGNDFVLKKYAGLPVLYRLKVAVPHGFCPNDRHVWAAEAHAKVPVLFCFQSSREQAYAESTAKTIFRAAAPFLYLVEMLKTQPEPQRKGAIFFPGHSTHHIEVRMDYEALADKLIGLADEYQPVTVCIYWRDFTLGRHLPFQGKGLNVVSAGHMFDPLFLFRLYHLCSLHRYAASNEFGSQVFYSLAAGCSYFHLDTVKTFIADVSDIGKGDLCDMSPERRALLTSLFSEPRRTVTREQMDVVNVHLGARNLKSPQGLRRQLLRAELLDKLGVIGRNKKGRKRLVVPCYYRRLQIRRRVRSIPGGVARRLSRVWHFLGKEQGTGDSGSGNQRGGHESESARP